MNYIILMHPPNRIRGLRKAARMSQTELGDLVGLTQGQIGHLENGERNLTLEWMKRIARALNVSAAELLLDEDNPDRLASEEREVVEAMRHADPQARHHIRAMATAIASTANDDQKKTA